MDISTLIIIPAKVGIHLWILVSISIIPYLIRNPILWIPVFTGMMAFPFILTDCQTREPLCQLWKYICKNAIILYQNRTRFCQKGTRFCHFGTKLCQTGKPSCQIGKLSCQTGKLSCQIGTSILPKENPQPDAIIEQLQ